MYGWRGLIAFITPTYRGRTIKALYDLLPEGVGLIPSPLGISHGTADAFEESFQKAEEAAKTLALWGVDVMTQPGIPPWIVKGPEFESAWTADIEEATGVPFITPMDAGIRAMQDMNVKAPLLVTYFGDELNSKIAEYLQMHALQPVVVPGYRLTDQTEALYNTPLIQLSTIGPGLVYRFVRSHATQETNADGVFIIGGGWEAWEAVEPLERDLGIPVIYALSATLRACLQRIGVNEPVEGQGDLLRLQSRAASV